MGFDKIYRQYSADIYRYVLWSLGDTATAEDITAETFTRAWAGADDLRIETVRSYLFTIARNLVRTKMRGRKVQVELSVDLSDPSPGPDRSAESRQRLEPILTAISELPEIDRSALLLRAWEGLPYEEVARILELSVSATKVKVHRVRRRLHEMEASAERNAEPDSTMEDSQ